MNKETILKKAIEKAVKGGYRRKFADCWLLDLHRMGYEDYDKLIFSHAFCKAFFNHKRAYKYTYKKDGKIVSIQTKGKSDKNVWKYHIGKLAESKDRLEYIKRFMGVKE